MDDLFGSNIPQELPEEAEFVEESLAFNAGEIQHAMQQDMDAFAAVAAPDSSKYAFPPFFKTVWDLITRAAMKPGRVFERLAIGIPRGHAKTAVIKLYVLFCILFTKKRYILIVGASVTKARASIADIIRMLGSPNIRSIFGDWDAETHTNTQDKKVFRFRGRLVVLEGAGTGTAIRGANEGDARPDVMIFDDTQTAECNKSDTEAEAYRTWFFGTALKAKSMYGCVFIYIGNMYPDIENPPQSGLYNCMLRNLQRDPAWTSLVTGAILEDGTALWEELQPLEELLKEWAQDKRAGQEEIFLSEALNIPNGTKSRHVDTSKFHITYDADFQLHQGHFFVLDPATSKATPDQFVFNECKVFSGRVCSINLIVEKLSAPLAVHRILDLCLQRGVHVVFVEANAYQYTLVEWLEFITAQRGIFGINFIPYTQHQNKNGRLLKWMRGMEAGEMSMVPEVASLVKDQCVKFNPAKSNNLDDIIDSMEMAQRCAIIHSSELIPYIASEYTPATSRVIGYSDSSEHSSTGTTF